MNKLFIILVSCISLTFLMSIDSEINTEFNYPEKLSDFALFKGHLQDQIPAEDVLPYALNSPLFSDFAHKLRFIKMPKGTQVNFNPDSVLQFPVGTIIAKTFYYKNDERAEAKGRRLMETRILIHEAKGWKALPYIWNKEQNEATLEVAGGGDLVSWIDDQGKKQSFEYVVPNMNQCKGCHERQGIMTPIGPSARQLNGEFIYEDGAHENQLAHWAQKNALVNLPKLSDVPKIPSYSDLNASLDLRAKAYLDINCAHCHNPVGPAQSSGLFLHWNNPNKTSYGFMKTPVAAGRGSGNLSYDIVPGKPEESILAYRMHSLDPGIMMPELGRRLSHKEGVDLIKNWIKSL